MAIDEYQLRCELRGHDDGVRGICVCGNAGIIATSSWDRTVWLWSPDTSDERKYLPSRTLLGHSNSVGPLAWISPSEEYPEGRVVSGGMDTLVLVWDLRSGEKVLTLEGHDLQVTGVALDNGDVVSASVDCTLRRWRNGQLVEFWQAHQEAIQAVIKLPSGELVTGSRDATLKLWRGRTCLHTFVGHSGTVQGLAVMSGLGFLSASHDGSIRLWALSGQVLMEMVGHTSIVYSVDSHVSGLIVSGSTDCSAKIWKDGVCVQSIEHPGYVWDAKFLENGDIVTACSDGVVRIWTVHKYRTADSLELESYALKLSQFKVSRKRLGRLKLENLPGLEALQVPGTSDVQTKVIREGENGVAYTWNLREQKWDKIGKFTDGPDDNMKRPVLDGTRYDYVFDVDIGDGKPVRKLPYNRYDNAYDTAETWLLKENLPLSYRQQIVEFIQKNSGQRDSMLYLSFHDPNIDSSGYIPGQPSNMSGEEYFMTHLVEEYFKTSSQTLEFCTALEECLKQAGDSQLLIRDAVQQFEEETKVGGSGYVRTLQALKKFEAASDPFTQEFFISFKAVFDQQGSMRLMLELQKNRLDKKLKCIHAWRKVSCVIFVTTFASVLIGSIMAAAMAAPRVAAALAAASAIPVGSMGKWIDSKLKNCKDALEVQKRVSSSMEGDTYVAHSNLDNILRLVSQLRSRIISLLQTMNVFIEQEDVKGAIEEIKKKPWGVFTKNVEELRVQAGRCRRDIRRAESRVLQRIKHPK